MGSYIDKSKIPHTQTVTCFGHLEVFNVNIYFLHGELTLCLDLIKLFYFGDLKENTAYYCCLHLLISGKGFYKQGPQFTPRHQIYVQHSCTVPDSVRCTLHVNICLLLA